MHAFAIAYKRLLDCNKTKRALAFTAKQLIKTMGTQYRRSSSPLSPKELEISDDDESFILGSGSESEYSDDFYSEESTPQLPSFQPKDPRSKAKYNFCSRLFFLWVKNIYSLIFATDSCVFIHLDGLSLCSGLAVRENWTILIFMCTHLKQIPKDCCRDSTGMHLISCDSMCMPRDRAGWRRPH